MRIPSSAIPTLRRSLPFVAYLATLIMMTVRILPLRYEIPFVLYASYLFLILSKPQEQPTVAPTTTDRFFTILTIAAFLIVLLSRIIPFIRYGASPLGYDTGFYWQYFHLIIPAGNIGTATGSHLAYVPWFPVTAFGLTALNTIHFFHVVHQLLTAGAMYVLLRSIAPSAHARAIAACGVFLFAISANQFFAYWWMFYKQSFAIPFFIFALALFFRRSWIAIPVTAFAAAIHLPTAIPLGAGFALLVLLSLFVPLIRRQPIPREVIVLATGGIIAVITVALLKGTDDIQYYLNLLFKYRGLATNARSWEIEQIKGLFIPSSAFRLAVLYYLPFALIGAVEFLRHQRLRAHGAMDRPLILLTTIAILLVLVSFPFIHQHRSLIFLDILLLLIAAEAFARFVRYGLGGRLDHIVLGLFLIGLTSSITSMVWHQKPQLYADEARELSVLERTDTSSDIRKADDYIMVTSALYTPWAYAYTGFGPTIAPGWLTWDRWDLSRWGTFWHTNDNGERLNLLRMYGDHDIYIFIGRHVLEQSPNSPLHTFLKTDPHFTLFSPHIWKYSPSASIPDGHSQ